MDRLYNLFIILHLSIVVVKTFIATTAKLQSLKLLIAKTPLCMCMLYFMNWLTYELWIEQEGRSLITPKALAHPLHHINIRSRNKRRDLWAGRCVSSWWPLFPSKNSVLIYEYLYVCIPYTSTGYRTYIYIHRGCRSMLVKMQPIMVYGTGFWECAVPVLNATCSFL